MWKKENWMGKVWGILIGLLTAYVITLIGLLLLALGLYQWRISGNVVEIGILVLYFLSCLVGGMITGKKAENRKFLWGFFLGLGYFCVLLILSLTGGQPIALGAKEMILPGIICLLSGMLGGMLA